MFCFSLFTFRFLAVSAIALLLLAPVAKQTVNEQQKPVVVVAQDVSESVDSNQWIVSRGQLIVESEEYEVVYEEFGGSTTDIAAALQGIVDRYQGRNLGAVVLATDGIYNRGSNPTTTAERLTFPVYTIALGDTTPQRDAALVNIRHNRIAFSGNTFPVEITINATRLKGHSAHLSISNSQGKSVAQQGVEYSDNSFSTTLTFDLKAEKPGLQRYTARLSVVDGERTAENNVLTFYTDILDSRRKVAIVGSAPHPDLAALKQAVESNPNFEAKVFLNEELKTKNEELKDVSLLILHNLPSSTQQLPTPNSQLSTLNSIYIIGSQTDLPRFNALHTGLEIVAKTKKSNEVTALFNDRFSLFTLDGADAATIEDLPPLSAPFGEIKSSPNLQSLFTARLGNINTGMPLVATMVQGTQRQAFVWGEGLWRWRLNDFLNNKTHDHFDRLVSQLVNFAAITDSRERFIVETKRHYSDNDEITVCAQLYNESYETFNTPDATFSLQGDSIKGSYNFSRQNNGYTLSLGTLPEGLYHYTATTTSNGKEYTANGAFAVEALHLEQANLTADHSMLATLSTITGGEMYPLDKLSTLNSQLSTLKPVIYTHTRFSELLNLPWVLVLIVLLLGTEWVMRKYHGEV
ncbi:MAG: hypothetical protein J5729_06305 [Bacteroidaceae bacterium]|nr:hypothetical protein [Bacteroidaceae bacterium]